MKEEKPAVDICKDPRPGSAEGRLGVAIAAVDSALGCVDLRPLRWTPIAADAWERAVAGLRQARAELAAALQAWQAQRKEP